MTDPNDLFVPPKADRAWKYVVLHHSGQSSGSYARLDRDDRKNKGLNGCSQHFIIGNGTETPDGQIEVASRWSDQKGGAHARDARDPAANEYGIGVCLVGDFDKAPPTKRQVEAARALVAYLQERYNVPADRVGTHDKFASSPDSCPGKLFASASILKTSHVAAR